MSHYVDEDPPLEPLEPLEPTTGTRLLDIAPIDRLHVLTNTWALGRATGGGGDFIAVGAVALSTRLGPSGIDVSDLRPILFGAGFLLIGLLGQVVRHPSMLSVRALALLVTGPWLAASGFGWIGDPGNVILAIIGVLMTIQGINATTGASRMWLKPTTSRSDPLLALIAPMLERAIRPKIVDDGYDPVIEVRPVVADRLGPFVRVVLMADSLMLMNKLDPLPAVFPRDAIRWRWTVGATTARPRMYLRTSPDVAFHLQLKPDDVEQMVDWLPAEDGRGKDAGATSGEVATAEPKNPLG
ncbi:MAG: hypothetical protein AB7K09_05145 [Planctomycetota bacterium]